MATTQNGEKLLEEQLQSLWSAENMLVHALPAIIKKISNEGLRNSIAHHYAETDQHKVAIEQICKQLEIDASNGDNPTMKSILEEGEMAMSGKTTGEELDRVIIQGAKKIEQYEIYAYPPAADYAEALGYEGIAKRLRLTLEEEKQADTKLKSLEKNLYGTRAEIGQTV